MPDLTVAQWFVVIGCTFAAIALLVWASDLLLPATKPEPTPEPAPAPVTRCSMYGCPDEGTVPVGPDQWPLCPGHAAPYRLPFDQEAS